MADTAENLINAIWEARQYEAVLTGLLTGALRADQALSASFVEYLGGEPKAPLKVLQQVHAEGKIIDIVVATKKTIYVIEAKKTTKDPRSQAKASAKALSRALKSSSAPSSLRRFSTATVEPVALAVESKTSEKYTDIVSWRVVHDILINLGKKLRPESVIFKKILEQNSSTLGTRRPSISRARVGDLLHGVSNLSKTQREEFGFPYSIRAGSHVARTAERNWSMHHWWKDRIRDPELFLGLRIRVDGTVGGGVRWEWLFWQRNADGLSVSSPSGSPLEIASSDEGTRLISRSFQAEFHAPAWSKDSIRSGQLPKKALEALKELQISSSHKHVRDYWKAVEQKVNAHPSRSFPREW